MGKKISVDFSKFNQLKMSQEGKFDRNYQNERKRHRYRVDPRKVANFVKHLTSPTAVLHIANFPPETDANQLRSLLAVNDREPQVEYFQKGDVRSNRMALAQFDTIDDS